MGRTSSITVWWRSWVERRLYSDVLCLFLFVTLWNDEVCDNGNAMKRCNLQNSYGVVAYRKVCSCAPIFNFFRGPQHFPIGENLYQELRLFAIFKAVGPHFLKPER